VEYLQTLAVAARRGWTELVVVSVVDWIITGQSGSEGLNSYQNDMIVLTLAITWPRKMSGQLTNS
jgi:hypothetical protein